VERQIKVTTVVLAVQVQAAAAAVVVLQPLAAMAVADFPEQVEPVVQALRLRLLAVQ
jgi:hypothetical protein